MSLYRRGDDDRFEIAPLDHPFWTGDALQVRIQRTRVFQPSDVQIAHNLEPAVRQTPKVSNQKGSPVPASKDANSN